MVTKSLSRSLYQGQPQTVPLPTTLPQQNFLLQRDSLRSRALGTSLATAGETMEWNRTYGGSSWDEAYSILQTADGGYALAGSTESFGEGYYDAWLVKTDPNGTVKWTRTYGGMESDTAYAIIQTADGGYALAGRTCTYGAGGFDFWLVKTNARGAVEWKQTYGGPKSEWPASVIQTNDGGFALAGTTASYGAGNEESHDAWLVKTDAHGNMDWAQTYDGGGFDAAFAVIQTADGELILAGSTTIETGRASYTKDCWLVKIDIHGNMKWIQTINGNISDVLQISDVFQTTGGGLILVGGYHVIKTDAGGVLQWTRTYEDFWAHSLIQTVDRGFIVFGKSASDCAGLMKIDAFGEREWTRSTGGMMNIDIFGGGPDCIFDGIQTADGGFAFAGFTESYGAGEADFWLVKTPPISSWLPVEPTPLELFVPTVTVVNPNGGESWQEMQTITWTATDPQSDPLTYTVYYSPNDGQTWIQLATGLTDPSYLWDTTTIVNGATFLIKVVASDGMYTGVDVSDMQFEIANEATNTAPTVRVLQPNGGERVRGMFEIQWSAHDPDEDPLTFTLSYSPNEGQTWTQLASGVTGTSYQWETSGVQVGTTYLIKVEASDGVLRVEDRSDASFTVEREVPTETSSKGLFVPSFRVVEALGAILVILGLGKRRKWREMLWEEQ